MSFRDWLLHLLGHRAPASDPAREVLDRQQGNLADRLAKLKGVTRDEVLNEAYRRADRILSEKAGR